MNPNDWCFVTHSEIVKVVGPVSQLFVSATRRAEVRCGVVHGEHTGTHTHSIRNVPVN